MFRAGTLRSSAAMASTSCCAKMKGHVQGALGATSATWERLLRHGTRNPACFPHMLFCVFFPHHFSNRSFRLTRSAHFSGKRVNVIQCPPLIPSSQHLEGGQGWSRAGFCRANSAGQGYETTQLVRLNSTPAPRPSVSFSSPSAAFPNDFSSESDRVRF